MCWRLQPHTRGCTEGRNPMCTRCAAPQVARVSGLPSWPALRSSRPNSRRARLRAPPRPQCHSPPHTLRSRRVTPRRRPPRRRRMPRPRCPCSRLPWRGPLASLGGDAGGGSGGVGVPWRRVPWRRVPWRRPPWRRPNCCRSSRRSPSCFQRLTLCPSLMRRSSCCCCRHCWWLSRGPISSGCSRRCTASARACELMPISQCTSALPRAWRGCCCSHQTQSS